jgi:hypothetical protein
MKSGAFKTNSPKAAKRLQTSCDFSGGTPSRLCEASQAQPPWSGSRIILPQGSDEIDKNKNQEQKTPYAKKNIH